MLSGTNYMESDEFMGRSRVQLTFHLCIFRHAGSLAAHYWLDDALTGVKLLLRVQ